MLFSSLAICQTPAAGSGKQNEKPAWEVNNPPGPRSTARIDTRTGTWMNLDVSPEGNGIVFELLGDIYSMPIAGGERAALGAPGLKGYATGPGWDGSRGGIGCAIFCPGRWWARW